MTSKEMNRNKEIKKELDNIIYRLNIKDEKIIYEFNLLLCRLYEYKQL